MLSPRRRPLERGRPHTDGVGHPEGVSDDGEEPLVVAGQIGEQVEAQRLARQQVVVQPVAIQDARHVQRDVSVERRTRLAPFGVPPAEHLSPHPLAHELLGLDYLTVTSPTGRPRR